VDERSLQSARIRTPDRPAHYIVTILIELSRLQFNLNLEIITTKLMVIEAVHTDRKNIHVRDSSSSSSKRSSFPDFKTIVT